MLYRMLIFSHCTTSNVHCYSLIKLYHLLQRRKNSGFSQIYLTLLFYFSKHSINIELIEHSRAIIDSKETMQHLTYLFAI